MEIVERADEAEEWDDGGDFVKDEEGSYVGDGSIVEGGDGRTQKSRRAAEDACDTVRLGKRGWRWRRGR